MDSTRACPFGTREPVERWWYRFGELRRLLLVHVHVSESAVLPGVERALQRGGCVTHRVGERTLRVVRPHCADRMQARVELQFFLRALQRARPDATTTLLP